MDRLSGFICKRFWVFLILFALLVTPAYYGYSKTNDEVYYDMGQCLPEDLPFVKANEKLSEDFNVSSTLMLLVDADTPAKQVKEMAGEMEKVDGVAYVLGLDSLLGDRIPEEMIPDSVKTRCKATTGSCCWSTRNITPPPTP